MDTLQCAVVLAKFERFDAEIKQRLILGERYNELLDAAGISRVRVRPDRASVFGQYTVFVEEREMLQEKLKQAGVPTAVHYPIPLNEQPAYKHLCNQDPTPISKQAAQKVMSLPMSADLCEASLIKVVEALRN